MSGQARLRAAGDQAVLIEVDDNREALDLAAAVRSQLGAAVEDVVPGHRTVLVTWPACAADPSAELLRLLEGPVDVAAPETRNVVELGVRYDGPDLAAVAEHTGLTPAQVIEIHCGASYQAGFVGYAPGFAYLLGGDSRLEVPRRGEPRPRIPAGSVALAGPYTAVYPNDAPGGWQLIGRTEVRLFAIDRDPPSLLAPGVTVRFRAEA